MRRLWWIALLASVSAPAGADLMEMRDGRVLEGLYLGGTEQTVRFKVGDSVEVFHTDEVVQVRFTGTPAQAAARPRPSPPASPPRPAIAPPAPARTAATAPAPPPAPAPAPARSPVPAPTASGPAPRAQTPPPAPAAPRLVRVEAGTRLRVRMVDGIDPRQSAVGDRFAATLEIGLGVDGVAILPVGTKLYGQVAELRATGPVATRLKLELTDLMIQGQLQPIVTGSHQLAETESAGPASASTIPARPGVSSGALLEFRLLQPFDLRIP